jgi:hypothetical protein
LGAPDARNGPTLNQAPSTALAASQAGAKRMMRRFIMRPSRFAWPVLTRGTQARSRTNRNGSRASTYRQATIVNDSWPNWSCSLPPSAAPNARPTTVAAS